MVEKESQLARMAKVVDGVVASGMLAVQDAVAVRSRDIASTPHRPNGCPAWVADAPRTEIGSSVGVHLVKSNLNLYWS